MLLGRGEVATHPAVADPPQERRDEMIEHGRHAELERHRLEGSFQTGGIQCLNRVEGRGEVRGDRPRGCLGQRRSGDPSGGIVGPHQLLELALGQAGHRPDAPSGDDSAMEQLEPLDVSIAVEPLPTPATGRLHHLVPALPGSKHVGAQAGAGGDDPDRVFGGGGHTIHSVTACGP